ncbi:MAG: tRNA pseudouridine(55) synthase TruB [Candidatus Gastranaerophilaceae bacterium]
MLGFLNIYKPKGITSHDVIHKLRKALKIKKIGHAGTLDPLAEGVLPVAISYATKLIDFLPEDKEYIADFKFGYTSLSYDAETELEKFSDKTVTLNDVENILPEFFGDIKQRPPIYSAIKVGGQKLYELARNGVSDVEVPERTINVSKIEPVNFDENTQTGKILIACSKGTYIRSIINDIGQRLGVGAVMTSLIRSKSGGMSVENSVNVNDITDVDVAQKYLINLDKVFNFASVEIDDVELERVKNGNSIRRNISDGFAFIVYNSEIIAFAEISSSKVKIKKVFLQ